MIPDMFLDFEIKKFIVETFLLFFNFVVQRLHVFTEFIFAIHKNNLVFCDIFRKNRETANILTIKYSLCSYFWKVLLRSCGVIAFISIFNLI